MTVADRLPTIGLVVSRTPSHDPVAQLRDRIEVAELLAEYCLRCDLNDPDGVADCFTDDCVATYVSGPPSYGKAARRDAAARDLALFDATSHHLSNLTITFESPDRARTSSYVYAWHRPRASGADWVLHAQYHDVVVRTEAGWRIAERRMLTTGAVGFPPEWEWLHVPR